MGMDGKYLLARLLRVLLTLWGVVTLTFVLGRLAGDPVALLIPQTASVADAEVLRKALGLDRPLLEQYLKFLGQLLQGEMGQSIAYNRNALSVVLDRVPATLQLGIPALVIAALLGTPLGIWAAVTRKGWPDQMLRSLSLLSVSLPGFIHGILLILLFGVAWQLLPTFGSDSLSHMVLPVTALALPPAALLIRLTRTAMLEVLGSDYVRTARGKGLSERIVLFRHAFRNALIPLVTVLGLELAGIIGGAVIVETVFAWPGMGLLAVESIASRDFPVIQAIVLLSAASFALINLLVDLSFALLDPRIGGGR